MPVPIRVLPSAPARLVVLASGAGSLLQSLLAAAVGNYPARVVAVGVDRDCPAERIAAAAAIPTFCVRLRDYPDRAAWDAAIAAAAAAHTPDLIVSAGFMKILGPEFLSRFNGRVVNTHPALLPAFPGAHAVPDALAYGVKVSGCTVHLVDAGVDTGPILAQQGVEVLDDDDEPTLHERIKVVERRLLVDVLAALATRGVTWSGHRATFGQRAQYDEASMTSEARRSSMAAQTLIGKRPIRRVLISVYDKSGLVALARGLHEAGVDIVSTGSTAKTIADNGIPVTPVEFVTGFPEVLDGRVKTLHPHIHAGLLADTRNPEHVAALKKLNIAPFDLVVVNLYPFSETVDSGAEIDECVEQIDIGGPSMVRAAAKNHASVAVVVEPLGYDGVLAAVRSGGFTFDERKKLAALAFRHTADYDVAVAGWMGSTLAPEGGSAPESLPPWLGRSWRRTSVLRYGENPHQRAALYSDDGGWPGLAQAEQLHGKEMSYNNFTDADAAWRAAFDHQQICVAIIKHANPCGIAISSTSVADAHRKAHDCDPLSAFGGVIAANTEVSVEMAESVSEIFTEVIIAPAYADGAVAILARKKNIRVLLAGEPAIGGVEIRQIGGGLLVQERDGLDAPGDDPASWTLAAGEAAGLATLGDLAFAWRTCRAVKSNAIVIAAEGATVGVGMGQVNRVDAARLAVERGGDRVRGAVAASDAFFPFPDGLEVLTNAGVTAVVHPGGSVRDDEVQMAAANAGITLYLTGARHFAH